MNKPILAIVDSNALCHIVKYSTRELSYNGDKTGVLYGLLKKLHTIQEIIFADKFVFAWDSDAILERKILFPEYKVKRGAKKKDPKEKQLNDITIPQFDIAREVMLPGMGFNNHFRIDGLEADDIISKIVKDYKYEYKCVIVSRDNDFHQLLEKDVMLFDPVKLGYFTEKAFIDKWGIGVDEWIYIKAIAGCKSDEVPGVEGVKEKTAIKFWTNKLKKTTKAYQNIIQSEEQMMLNLELVTLPWPSTPNINLIENNVNLNEFIKICTKYGFRSYLNEQSYQNFSKLFIKE